MGLGYYPYPSSPEWSSPNHRVSERSRPNQAALVILLFYRQSGRDKLYCWAFDPNAGRRGTNHLSAPEEACLGLDQGVSLDLPSLSQPLFLALTPYYQSSRVAVSGNQELPVQDYRIVADGAVNRGQTTVSRLGA